MGLFCRLVTEGGMQPSEAWNLPFPHVVALLQAWNAHPPLRWMVGRFLEYRESEW